MSFRTETLTDPFRIGLSFFRKLARQRHLIWNFAARDLKQRYVGSLMGFFWAVIHPLVLLVSYTFIFSVIFKARLPEPLPQSFALFAFSGILPWLFFQDTLSRSATSVIDNANLIRKSVFPSQILPLSILISNLVTHLVGLLILLAAAAWSGLLGAMALLIPLYLFLLGLLTLGLGWLAAALHVFLRDTAQVLSVALVMWFWFTPIFYQVEMAPEPLRPLLLLNPLTHVVWGYRDLVLLNRFPDLNSLAALAGLAVLAFVAGGTVFRLTKREFVDVL